MRLSIHPVAILTAILLPITTLAAPIYSYTDLGVLITGDPPKLYINDAGQVAGTYRPSAGSHSQAFFGIRLPDVTTSGSSGRTFRAPVTAW